MGAIQIKKIVVGIVGGVKFGARIAIHIDQNHTNTTAVFAQFLLFCHIFKCAIAFVLVK